MRKCRPLQRHFHDVTLTLARITDITLLRMTLSKCRPLQRDVTLTPARITDITLWRKCLCAGSHVVPRILHSLPTKKVKKLDHTYPKVSSRRRGRCVQSLVQKCGFVWGTNKQTNKNEQKTILAIYIRLPYVMDKMGRRDVAWQFHTHRPSVIVLVFVVCTVTLSCLLLPLFLLFSFLPSLCSSFYHRFETFCTHFYPLIISCVTCVFCIMH